MIINATFPTSTSKIFQEYPVQLERHIVKAIIEKSIGGLTLLVYLVLGEFHPRFIGIRGSEVNAADARGLFSFHTCHLNPAYARLGKRVLRIGTNVTYTFLPE